MGTHWELESNIDATCWEQSKNEKNPPPNSKLKRKKSRHLECMLQPTHWLHMYIWFPKMLVTIFGLG
jgi:hypothetical protein